MSHSEVTTEKTIKSIRAIHRENADIIIVNNKAHSVSRRYLNQLSDGSIRYYKRRIRSSMPVILKEAYKRSQRREVVVVLDSGTTINYLSIRMILVHRFARMERSPIEVNFVDVSSTELMGVIKSIASSLDRIIVKVSGVFSIKRTDINYAGFAYPKKIITRMDMRSKAPEEHGSIQFAERILQSYNVKNFARWCIWAGYVALLFLSAYSAVSPYGDVEAFISLWFSIIITIILLVSFDNYETLRRKINVLLCAAFVPILVLFALTISVKRYKHN